ncbi:putative MFS multidrug transporter [Microdochium trichocladiopsis]|uniref:MFS multidrug transporter n=1 Tax=Microdochium trichocladiopsis TaxID=1682393 RepID=A0A9P8XRP1_9PEZI|nr:putative MFS multidrug transporter [Microdochium trichocladiopsis]KAH7014168.1 putative MFS multidrug transporter [Microdochium trichocladiopsis]
MSANKANMAVVFPAIASGIFLAAADGTIVLVNYATISSELNALNKAQWIVTTYTFVAACFQPLYGKLCDIFGRKNCLVTAYILFATGCMACGMSTTIEGLIAARILQAVGGSGLGTVISILLTDLVPPEDRGVWQGLLNIMYLFGAGIGAPVGGFLAGSVGWRWSFIGQVPLCVLAIFVISWTLHDDMPTHNDKHDPSSASSQPSSTLLARLRRVDFLGAIALVTTISSFLFALDRGGNVSWSAPECYVPLIVSFFTGALFLYVETNIAAEPVMPPSVILSPALLPVYVSSSLAFFAIIALEFTLPLYYQARAGMSPQAASLFMIPAIIAGTSCALVTGFWMRRTGQYYRALLFACACQTVGGVVVFLFSGPVREQAAALVVGHVVSELGVGNVVVSGLIAVISLGSDSSSALRIAAYYSLRNMGSVLGVTVVSTIIQQGLRDLLTVELAAHGVDVDKIVDEVRHSLGNLRHLEPEIADIVRRCYGQAMNRGFLLILVAAALTFVPAAFIKGGREKRKKEETGPE